MLFNVILKDNINRKKENNIAIFDQLYLLQSEYYCMN